MSRRTRIPKADLVRIIEIAYRADMGPQQVATLTGYGRRYLSRVACMFGLRRGMGKRGMPSEIPGELLVLLARYAQKK